MLFIQVKVAFYCIILVFDIIFIIKVLIITRYFWGVLCEIMYCIFVHTHFVFCLFAFSSAIWYIIFYSLFKSFLSISKLYHLYMSMEEKAAILCYGRWFELFGMVKLVFVGFSVYGLFQFSSLVVINFIVSFLLWIQYVDIIYFIFYYFVYIYFFNNFKYINHLHKWFWTFLYLRTLFENREIILGTAKAEIKTIVYIVLCVLGFKYIVKWRFFKITRNWAIKRH